MAELFGLLFSLVALLIVALPILTFLRVSRLSAQVEALARQLQQLEGERDAWRAAAAAAPSASAGAPDDDRATPSLADPPPPAAGPEAIAPPSSSAPPYTTLADEAPSPSAPPIVAPPFDAGTQPPPLVAPPDLESRIGGRGLLYLGVLVLILGVSFFLKYAFDSGWVGETGRVVIGVLLGTALTAAGVRTARLGLDTFGHALSGTGLAVVYLSIYAALSLYQLIGPGVAFAAMALTTAAAAVLADRLSAQSLAMTAVVGGFLTPFLVSGRSDSSLTLFSYDALLVLGTLVLALRHAWMALNAVSYLLTFATLTIWSIEDYTSAQWLRTLLFLTLFAVLYLIILRVTARVPGWEARAVRWLLATAPVAYHLAAVAITVAHPPAVHVYLIAFTAAGLWLTAEPHRPWIRLAVLVGGLVPLFGSATLPGGRSWLLANLITVVVVIALHVTALIDRVARQRERLLLGDLVGWHLTGLAAFSLTYDVIRPIYPGVRGLLAWSTAAAAVAFAGWLRPRDVVASMNAIALAFTLVAIGFAVQFDGPAVVIGWGAQGAAAMWLGLRTASVLFQFGGLLLWSLATLRLLDGYFDTVLPFQPVLNARSLTTALLVVTGYWASHLFARADVPASGRAARALHITASALTLAWITAEIGSYWDLRSGIPQAYLYEHVMLSLAWGLYGATLVAIGMRRRDALARYTGIAILTLASAKVFFYDLWQLGGIYRVVGFIVFGVVLLVVSYLYQKRRTVNEA